jgi:structural maintenance of chromosome 1
MPYCSLKMGDIDTDMRETDKAKQKKSFLKSECDKLDEEVNTARRNVGTIAKELQTANKLINQLESQVESEKAGRHSILIQVRGCFHCHFLHERLYLCKSLK